MQLLVSGGITMTVTGQCFIGSGPVPARDTVTESATGGGPTVLMFVRPGKVAGCSAALIARIPAGKPVPTQLLRRIADELPAGLVS